jgi:CubicO group peptidase (beta-lactamase class C family)
MTKRILNVLGLVVGMAALSSVVACDNEEDAGSKHSAQDSVPERFREFAEVFEQERRALQIPGAAVAIVARGKLAFAHGFGTKGVNSAIPVSAHTLFRTASMGKVVTAIGAMSAVDDGLLQLDAPIRVSIPDLSLAGTEAERLTLRHLLSQQSGLSDFTAISGPTEDSGLAAFCSGPALAEHVTFINPPGLFWNYSNPNYYLAGRAIETSTGTSYREAIRRRVFEPLGMKRSFFLPSEVLADGDYTHGYGIPDIDTGNTDMQDIAPDAYDNAFVRPAGLGFSSVLDWAKLLQFLNSGNENVLSQSALHEVTRSQISTHTIYADVSATGLGLGDDYGLGIGVSAGFFMNRAAEPNLYYDVPVLGHGGDAPGFATTFAIIPSTGFGIVVLSNRDALRPVKAIRFALEHFADLPAPSAPPAGREPAPARFAKYAGTYRDVNGGELKITQAGDALTIATTLLDTMGLPYEPKLEPTSLDNFALWVTYQGERVPLELTFLSDPQGNFDWVRTRLAVAKRVEATEP